jgi:hypothetical protein
MIKKSVGAEQRRVGVWIDRRQAILVRLGHGTESIVRMESNVDERRRRTGERTRPFKGRNDMVSENKVQARWRQTLSRYIREVARVLRDADRVFILGPGRAKQELYKELLACGEGEKIVGFETTEQLTQRQLLAKVRSVFQGAVPPKRDTGASTEREATGPRPQRLSARAEIEAWIEEAMEPEQPA